MAHHDRQTDSRQLELPADLRQLGLPFDFDIPASDLIPSHPLDTPPSDFMPPLGDPE